MGSFRSELLRYSWKVIGFGFRWLLIASLAPGRVSAAEAAPGVEPDLFTLGKLTAWNRGPGALRAQVGWLIERPGVVVATGRAVIFKVDWHFADESTLRTLAATFAAEVRIAEGTAHTRSARRAEEVTSGPIPAALARNAAALEIPILLPAGVGLLPGRARLHAVARAYETIRDTGWQEFPLVVVRADLASPGVSPQATRAVGIAFGDLAWLEGVWPAASAARWLPGDVQKPHANGGTQSPQSPLPHSTTRAAETVREALRTLQSLFRPRPFGDFDELCATACGRLRACAAEFSNGYPPRIGVDLKTAAAALESAARKKTEERERKITETRKSSPKREKLRPLRNGDFRNGLASWSPTGEAAGRSPRVSVRVERVAGESVLCLRRTAGPLTIVSGGVEQTVNIPVHPSTRLKAMVQVTAHSPAGGGDLGTVFPLTVSVDYLAADGSRHTFGHSFYTLGKATFGPAATKVPAQKWCGYRSPAFGTLTPPAVRIVRVQVFAAGRSFLSRLKEVALSTE